MRPLLHSTSTEALRAEPHLEKSGFRSWRLGRVRRVDGWWRLARFVENLAIDLRSPFGQKQLAWKCGHSNLSCSGQRIVVRSSLQLLVGSFCLRSEEHTSELQSLMRISYAVFCLKKQRTQKSNTQHE